MASCEKCWADAYTRAFGTGKTQTEAYQELIEERKDDHCTPEEQAGYDATICPDCGTKTVHQYVKICEVW